MGVDKIFGKEESDETRPVEGQEHLEKKIDFMERAKYVAPVAAMAVSAYFIPEMKKKYSGLPDEAKERYTNTALIGMTVVGAIFACASGYSLYQSNKNKK